MVAVEAMVGREEMVGVVAMAAEEEMEPKGNQLLYQRQTVVMELMEGLEGMGVQVGREGKGEMVDMQIWVVAALSVPLIPNCLFWWRQTALTELLEKEATVGEVDVEVKEDMEDVEDLEEVEDPDMTGWKSEVMKFIITIVQEGGMALQVDQAQMAVLATQARMETMVRMAGQQPKEAFNGKCILNKSYWIKLQQDTMLK